MQNNLLVIVELGNADHSGVCANMLIDEFKKCELRTMVSDSKYGFWMLYVKHHKNVYCSGHTVITLNHDETERLETYAFPARIQMNPEVSNVLGCWLDNMSSGAISTQLCSMPKKI